MIIRKSFALVKAKLALANGLAPRKRAKIQSVFTLVESKEGFIKVDDKEVVTILDSIQGGTISKKGTKKSSSTTVKTVAKVAAVKAVESLGSIVGQEALIRLKKIVAERKAKAILSMKRFNARLNVLQRTSTEVRAAYFRLLREMSQGGASKTITEVVMVISDTYKWVSQRWALSCSSLISLSVR